MISKKRVAISSNLAPIRLEAHAEIGYWREDRIRAVSGGHKQKFSVRMRDDYGGVSRREFQVDCYQPTRPGLTANAVIEMKKGYHIGNLIQEHILEQLLKTDKRVWSVTYL